jgi:hypothetical protein
MAIAGLMVCETPAKGVLILQRIVYRINDATFIAERDELTVIGQWGDSSLLNLYSEPSSCQAASISATAKRHGAAGQKTDSQTTTGLGTPRRGQLLAKIGQGAEIGQLQDLRHLNLFIRVAGAIGAHAKDQPSR